MAQIPNEIKLKFKIDIEDSYHMLLLLKQIRRDNGRSHFLRYRKWLVEEIGLTVPKWLESLCEAVGYEKA